MTWEPTTTRGVWAYRATGSVTNGYTHTIAVVDNAPPRIVGLDTKGYEVTSFAYGTYDHSGGDGTGFLHLAPQETIGFQFDQPRVPYDPATVARWAVTPVPETGMMASWAGSDGGVLTKACGNPGGWF